MPGKLLILKKVLIPTINGCKFEGIICVIKGIPQPPKNNKTVNT